MAICVTFSQVRESLHENFLQIKVEEKELTFLLEQIALKNSQNSIFSEFLKMIKNISSYGEFLPNDVFVPLDSVKSFRNIYRR